MKRSWISILVVVGVLILAVIIIKWPSENTDEGVAKCIGENSVLYVQLGCHACEKQEELFGENYQYLNVVDCILEGEKCDNVEVELSWLSRFLCWIGVKDDCGYELGISATPTWIIDGVDYKGLQSIEKLQELTGC
ncbi:hypothetical protein ACFL0X_00980 [Nanoarchaeota archaeon]